MRTKTVESGANALSEALEGHVDVPSLAPPESVYEALASLPTHLEWAGQRKSAKTRLLTMDAPPGLAEAGTEFSSTGSDPNGTFHDCSVVTEAAPGRVFEFVTEAELRPRRGGRPVEWTLVHRYEIAPAPTGGSHVAYRYRITRISRLIGPLRLLRTPLAGVLRRAWASMTRKGLRNLVAVAEARSQG
jgi:uncharacterized protein YndB with AHSA1/START domain